MQNPSKIESESKLSEDMLPDTPDFTYFAN